MLRPDFLWPVRVFTDTGLLRLSYKTPPPADLVAGRIVFEFKEEPTMLCFLRSSAVALALASAGCAGMNHTDHGALVGTGLGTAAGAIIGHQSGNAGAGALIGAATGALAGGLVGSAEDAREERDAALAYAHGMERSRLELTNADVISMVHNGVGDEVILGAVRANGGRFDLSPGALIHLKQQGLSDNLISGLQTLPMRGPAPHVIVAEPPPVYVSPVVVRPRPTIVFEHYHGRGYGGPWRHRRHRHW